MKIYFKKLAFIISLFISHLFFFEIAYSAASQVITDQFYQNPAELCLVNQMQLLIGDLFLDSHLKFSGQSAGGKGIAESKVNNNLPYMLSATRLNKRFVIGLNLTPSTYGHIEWPLDSIVAGVATKTYGIYYRAVMQASYQFTNKLAIGAGINANINSIYELDFVIPHKGNQINKVSGLNDSINVGIYYKINSKFFLTAAYFSPVKAFGFGSSTLNKDINNNFSLNIAEPALAFIGLQQNINEKLFLEEKVYWSQWSILKNINFINTTTGSYIVPTNWRNSWSYQVLTRYSMHEKVAILGSVLYETNVDPTATNNIGYPVSNTVFLSGGLDIKLRSTLSTQLIYGYGTFVPDSKIRNAVSNGSISANVQAVALQFSYKT